MDISYLLTHLGEEREDYFNAVAPPIIQSSNFTYKTFDEFRTALRDEVNNPLTSSRCFKYDLTEFCHPGEGQAAEGPSERSSWVVEDPHGL